MLKQALSSAVVVNESDWSTLFFTSEVWGLPMPGQEGVPLAKMRFQTCRVLGHVALSQDRASLAARGFIPLKQFKMGGERRSFGSSGQVRPKEARRHETPPMFAYLNALAYAQRVLRLRIVGTERFIASSDRKWWQFWKKST